MIISDFLLRVPLSKVVVLLNSTERPWSTKREILGLIPNGHFHLASTDCKNPDMYTVHVIVHHKWAVKSALGHFGISTYLKLPFPKHSSGALFHLIHLEAQLRPVEV